MYTLTRLDPDLRARLSRRETRLHLTNGRIVDVRAGRYLPDSVSLVLQNGRILAMPGLEGQPSQVEVDQVLDLGGRTLIPGLFNTHCHIHMCLPAILTQFGHFSAIRLEAGRQIDRNMADCLKRGVTTIRDAATEDLSETRRLRSRIASGEIRGPRIIQAVVVSMEGSAWSPRRGRKARLLRRMLSMPFVEYQHPNSGVVTFPPNAEPSQVREAVDRAVEERQAQTIKIYEQADHTLTYRPGAPLMALPQLEALIEQAQRRGLPTLGHHVSRETFRRLVQSGVSGLVHVALDDHLQDDLALLDSREVIIEPTLSLAYWLSWSRVLPAEERDHPRMQLLDDFRQRTYRHLAQDFWQERLRPAVVRGIEQAGRKMRMFGYVDGSAPFRYHARFSTVGMDNLREMFERGVSIACGSDAGIPADTPAMVGLELDMIHLALGGELLERSLFRSPPSSGLSGADALRMATINSARTLGLEDCLGSLELGKLADIAVIDGDPLADYRLIGSPVAALFVEGKLVG